MQRLWAPWRMKYILDVNKTDGCIFCDMPKESKDGENFIVTRGKHAYVILNAFPYNNGHLLIVPYRHTAEMADLTDEEKLELMTLTQKSIEGLRCQLHPDGFNVGMNLGRAAGAGIDEHIHLHLVPRWSGDTNFMPVVGDTKVVAEGLEDCFNRLRCAFE
jgi:ATP adenylyltransferase